jgi:hypothetical protein
MGAGLLNALISFRGDPHLDLPARQERKPGRVDLARCYQGVVRL